MSIKLDWQVEATDGQQQIGEDPAVVAVRQRRSRRWRRALIAAGVFALIAGAVALARYWQIQQARREMLVATVHSEALALRIGDLGAFMRRQGDDEIWQGQQIRLFHEFQSLSPAVEIPGEIITLRIAGDEAQVTVREVVDGAPAEGVWLYEYTDKGWRHVSSPQEPWSQNRTRVVEGFVFAYKRPSEPLVDDLEAALVQWRGETLALIGGGDLPTLQVWVEPRTGAPAWQGAERRILVIPGNRSDGAPLTELNALLRARLAELLAQHWNQALFEGMEIGLYNLWIEEEMAALLRHRFDSNAPPAVMLEPLIRAFGPDLIPEFLLQLRETHIPSDALSLAMSAAAPRDLSDAQLREYLASFLQAEQGLRSRTNQEESLSNHSVRVIFTDGSGFRLGGEPEQPFILFLPPETPLDVRIDHTFGDELWVAAHGVFDPPDSDAAIPVKFIGLVPFRQANGYWARADVLADEDWGQLQENDGELITLRYTGLDGVFAAGSLPELESSYRQAAVDFGVLEPPQVRLTLVNSSDLGSVRNGGGIIDLRIQSPHYLPCINVEDIRDCYRSEAVSVLVWGLLDYALGRTPGVALPMHGLYYPNTTLDHAVGSWEIERLGGATPDWYYGLTLTDTPITPPDRLEDLWLDDHGWDDSTESWVRSLGLRALLDVLVEQVGIGVLPLLLQHSGSSASMQVWLTDSLGVTLVDIEPLWRERFLRRLEAQGIPLSVRVWYTAPLTLVRDQNEH